VTAEQIALYAGGVAGVLGLVGLLFRTVGRSVRTTYGVVKKIDIFLGQWFGQPDTGAPSFPARMEAVETRVQATDHRLMAIEAQLRPNGGSSLRDTVNDIANATGARRQGD